MTEFDADIDALADFIGQRDVAEALALWADGSERKVELPANPWKAAGYTDALAVSLFIRGAEDEGDRHLVGKIVSTAERREIRAHRDALKPRTQFTTNHLVALRFDPVPVGTSKMVYFQDLAGGTRRHRPASALDPHTRPETIIGLCEAVSLGIAADWNTALRGSVRVSVAEFAARELHHPLSGKASIDRWASAYGLDDPSAQWITTPDDEEAMPNPVLLTLGHPALGNRSIQVVKGHSHGDLHLGNIIVLTDESGTHPETFRLIDLSTYSESASLARDQLALLLSAVAQFWPSLSDGQREWLLDDLTKPDGAGHPRRDPLLHRLLRTTFDTLFGRAAERGMEGWWHEQYLITLAVTALRFTTFENLGPERRWWFLRLACRGAKQYFALLGIPCEDSPSRSLHNPFSPDLPTVSMSAMTTVHPSTSRNSRETPEPEDGDGRLLLDGILPGRWGGTPSHTERIPAANDPENC